MYPVSAAYKTAMKSGARFEYVRGYINGVMFEDENVLTMSYTNRCSDTSDITFGSVYIGQLKAEFHNILINRGEWRNAVITVDVGLHVADDEIEWVPLGLFTVASAEWTDNGVSILANDNIIKFDKSAVGVNISGGSAYSVILYCCNRCGLVLATTPQEMDGWTNNGFDFEWNSENDVQTFRDIVGYAAACLGACVTADRDGAIKIVRLIAPKAEFVDTIDRSDRIIGSVFADFKTLYAGVAITRKSAKTGEPYRFYYTSPGVDPSLNKVDEYYIDMGNNPLLNTQYPQHPWEVDQALQHLGAAAYTQLDFTPYKISMLSNIVYDMGDIIFLRGWIPGESSSSTYGQIHQIDWTLKHLTEFQGFGSDPNLKLGKSASGKSSAGSSSSAAMNEMTYISYENAEYIEIPEDSGTIVTELEFVAKEATQVDIWHEYHLQDLEPIEANEPIEARLVYYLDDNMVAFFPIEHWTGGERHILGTNYFINGVSKGERHEWKVVLFLHNATGLIDVGQGRALLRGQKLEGDGTSHDTLIKVSDYIGRFNIKTLSAKEFTESVRFIQQTILTAEADDVLDRQNIEELTVREFSESVNIRLRFVCDWMWMSGQAYSGDTLDDTLF